MIIEVSVNPNSSNNSIEEIIKNKSYSIKIKERAEKDKANLAVIKMLAKYFNTSSANIKIKSGITSRNKLILIDADKK